MADLFAVTPRGGRFSLWETGSVLADLTAQGGCIQNTEDGDSWLSGKENYIPFFSSTSSLRTKRPTPNSMVFG